ncbi:MAG: hypothetical protein ABDH91_00925 [Bacteroidia bacterium]
MLLWTVLWLMALGQIGTSFGVHLLFYNPGAGPTPTFWDTCTWGIAYALFTLAYHFTTYLLDGHHAGFLLREPRPFLQYTLNNSLLPLTFWLYYLHCYTQYHAREVNFWWQLLGHAVGFLGMLLGMLFLMDSLAKDIFRLGKLGLLSPHQIYHQIAHARPEYTPVRYYLAIPGGIRPTWLGKVLQRRALTLLLLRYHRNAFILEVGLLGLIALWGYIQQIVEVYLSAASAFLVLWAILCMMIGAVAFWLRRWGGWAILLLVGGGAAVLYQPIFQAWSSAYGLRYKASGLRPSPPAREKDSLGLVECIARRAARQERPKAPLVWIQVSGGGWRSAFWTLRHLQYLDSLSGGRLWRRTLAISGASGGLIGAALWRELGLFYPERRWDPSEPFYLTQDALNPIVSTGLVGLLSPTAFFYDSVVGESYLRGRGYAFEQALIRNARAFYRRRLGDYAPFERAAECPLLFITPTLLQEGKPLLISSQSCSILTAEGVLRELRQLVPDADQLHLVTALRMNAAFPFVLPPVRLPTQPFPQEVIDAGAIDNFGELIALQFLWKMRHALAQHAERIILIQIRDLPLSPGGPTEEPRTPLEELAQRLGGIYSSVTVARQRLLHLAYDFLQAAYPIPIEKHVLAYSPSSGYIPPLGLTLHADDRAQMERAFAETAHQQHLQQVLKSLE